MSQPTPYTRQFGFADFAASFPSSPLPGASVDAELNAVLATFFGILANLARLQRDDGALKNNIVTLDSLSPAVMLALGPGVAWSPRGAWQAATAYVVSDVLQSGSGSYVCAIAHTSGISFAADFAAGRWVLLFDSAGSTPADGSVTAEKLADGAVTARAIGATTLDLVGGLRAAGGVQAGTAPLGGLFHAKRDAGDALAKIERKTNAQGAVGYQIAGVGITWTIGMKADATGLSISSTALAEDQTIFTALGGLDQAGTLRAVAGVVPASGEGVGLTYTGGAGYLTAYNYTTAAWIDLRASGREVTIVANGVEAAQFKSTGAEFPAAKIAGRSVGFADIPQNAQSGAYTLALADRGFHVYSSNTAGQTIVIPTNAAVAFPVGSTVAIINDGAGPIVISAAGIILKQAGSANTGNRTLAANGIATLVKVATDRWFISGAGIG